MRLLETEYELLAKDENQLEKAIKSNYCRICNRDVLKEYAVIYKRIFNNDSKLLNGCSRCVLADIKKLADVYFQDKNEMEELAKNTAIETIEDEKPIEVQKKTTKASTTKKTANKNKKK